MSIDQTIEEDEFMQLLVNRRANLSESLAVNRIVNGGNYALKERLTVEIHTYNEIIQAYQTYLRTREGE